jgi:hypothetical protein
MEKIYSYLGDEHFARHLATHFETALEGNGYSMRVDAGSAVGPHIMEYAKGEADEARIISLSIDQTSGDPGEAAVILETEEFDQDVAAVVAEGLFGLLADASKRLLESVDDAATKAQIVDRLTEYIAGLK